MALCERDRSRNKDASAFCFWISAFAGMTINIFNDLKRSDRYFCFTISCVIGAFVLRKSNFCVISAKTSALYIIPAKAGIHSNKRSDRVKPMRLQNVIAATSRHFREAPARASYTAFCLRLRRDRAGRSGKVTAIVVAANVAELIQPLKIGDGVFSA
jgi:hypothetical protein